MCVTTGRWPFSRRLGGVNLKRELLSIWVGKKSSHMRGKWINRQNCDLHQFSPLNKHVERTRLNTQQFANVITKFAQARLRL